MVKDRAGEDGVFCDLNIGEKVIAELCYKNPLPNTFLQKLYQNISKKSVCSVMFKNKSPKDKKSPKSKKSKV